MINNGITAPRGFLASGVSCGLKEKRKKRPGYGYI